MKKREYEVLPDGIYFAKLTEVDTNKPLSDRFPRKEDEPQFNIEYTFEVTGDEMGNKDCEGRKQWLTAHPYSGRNLEVYNACMGTDLKQEDEPSFNTDEIIGKMVRILVEVKKKANGSLGNKVEKVMPLPRNFTAQAPDGSGEGLPSEDEIDISDIPFGGEGGQNG